MCFPWLSTWLSALRVQSQGGRRTQTLTAIPESREPGPLEAISRLAPDLLVWDQFGPALVLHHRSNAFHRACLWYALVTMRILSSVHTIQASLPRR